TIDLGAGPVLLICLLPLIAYRTRRPIAVAIVFLSALPWLYLHHAINYAIAGTFKPANAVPEYLQYPGSGFDASNMTGLWNHKSAGHFLVYAVDLLVGRQGFLSHNMPLILVFPAIWIFVRQRVAQLPEALFACFWCGGTWLA